MAYSVGFGLYGKVDTYKPKPNIRPLDGDTRKIQLIDPTQDEGTRFTGIGFSNVGRHVLPENMPTLARREGTGLTMYPKLDFHRLNGLALVSQKAKDAIESFEPTVHQFFPVEVTIGKRDEEYGVYFILFLGNRIETLERKLSGPYNKIGICSTLVYGEGELTLDSKQIDGHHLWVDPFVAQGMNFFFISDEIMIHFKKLGITGLGELDRYIRIPETKDSVQQ
ncbi:hypothetical protein HGD87_05135 [Rhodobacteraceae bacterium R_SAG9]|nr:hypothetical protein [Rhodobacteraceae bacterium R_SAG9]